MQANTSFSRQNLLLVALLLIAVLVYTANLVEVSATEVVVTSAAQNGKNEKHIQGLRQRIGGSIHPALISSSVDQGLWRSREIDRHRLTLKPESYDYIVLPVQEFHPEIDRPSSLLSAHHIARAMKAQMGKKVMSPELALRLLGGRANVFDDGDVSKLAVSARAQVIYIYHVSNQMKTSNTPSIVLALTDFYGNVLRDEAYPIDSPSLASPLDTIVEPLAEQMVASFFTAEDSPSTRATKVVQVPWKFPDTLEEIPELSVSPGQKAAYLQLLAMLTPEEFEYDRRRLLERSLLALKSADPKYAHIRLLKSRALFHLSRRPAALKILGSPQSPAEQALVQLMNGNYPELKALVPAIEDQLLRVIARAELAHLGFNYKKGRLTQAGEEGLEGHWLALLESAYRDSDYWYAPNNLVFFSELAGLFPEYDQLLESTSRGQLVSGDMTTAGGIAKTFDTVFERGLRKSGAPGCCATYGTAVEAADLWTLYRNLFLANLLRDLYRSATAQGAYETAQALAERIEPYLSGHPRYSRVYSHALEGKAKRSQGSEKTQLMSRARELATETRINSASTDIDTIRADSVLQRLNQQVVDGRVTDYFTGDRRDYPTGIIGARISKTGEVIEYFHDNLGVVKQAAVDGSLTLQQVREILEGRLHGHPDRAVYLAKIHTDRGDRKQAIILLKKHLEDGEQGEKSYEMLGELLIEELDYNGASKLYLQYPLFGDIPQGQQVAVTNTAHTFGSRFYWLGRHEEAVPFYELASGLDTGAGNQYSSAGRLALMSGDYVTALQYSFQRGQRYNNRYGFRDYLALLHLMGQHEDAEAGAKALIPRYDEPQIWTSLFVGHRIQKRSSSEIAAWIDESTDFDSTITKETPADRYTLMSTVIDRKVSTEQLKTVDPLFSIQMFPRSLGELPKLSAVVDPFVTQTDGMYEDCLHPDGYCWEGVPRFVPGQYRIFLTAYHHLQEGEFHRALAVFSLIDRQREWFGDHNLQYLSPYLTMAATGALSSDGIKALLAYVEVEDPKSSEFDRELSKAVLYAKKGDRQKAIDALNAAYLSRPHTKRRPIFSWYQMTEVAEFMSEASGERIYIDMALDWARRYQIIQPQFGWAYAFEARYSKVKKDRIRAAAFALYLDAESRWLSQVPKRIRDYAEDWWLNNNPFTEDALEREKNATSL